MDEVEDAGKVVNEDMLRMKIVVGRCAMDRA